MIPSRGRTPHTDTEPPVVVVAHGSPDHRSQAAVREVAAAARATAAFLDFDPPHPVDVLTSLADVGHRRVIVVPLLLTRAYHGRVDIPRVAAAATAKRPSLSVEVTDPVGGAHLLPALHRGVDPDGALAHRHAASRSETRALNPGHVRSGADGVVLAAAGTRDRGTLAKLDALAAGLGRRSAMPAVAAYAASALPAVGPAIEQLRSRGATRIVVASYFIAPGVLHDRVAAAAAAAGAIRVTAPLGACDELVAAIFRRTAAAAMPALPEATRTPVAGPV